MNGSAHLFGRSPVPSFSAGRFILVDLLTKDEAHYFGVYLKHT
jgi:hypothetical protein